jgi:hypothetical protein
LNPFNKATFGVLVIVSGPQRENVSLLPFLSVRVPSTFEPIETPSLYAGLCMTGDGGAGQRSIQLMKTDPFGRGPE